MRSMFTKASSATRTVPGTQWATNRLLLREQRDEGELYGHLSTLKEDLHPMDPQSGEEPHLVERTPGPRQEDQELLPLPQLSHVFWTLREIL